MATPNFYLNNAPNKEGEILISLFFSYNGQRLIFSTGQSVKPKHWNIENQRVKKSCTGSMEINGVLDKVAEEAQKIYRTGVSNGNILSPSKMKIQLLKNLDREVKEKPKSLFQYYDEFIEVNKAMKSPNTIKKYRTFETHLKNFVQKKKYVLTFESIDSKFYEQFIAYCVNDLKYLNNTNGKFISNLKTFLMWANERGYHTNMNFLKFKTPKEEADIIYLTEKELMNLYEYDLSTNKRLENIRDTFCFSCFTGLRFSDIERLRKENIKGDELHFITQKTKDSLIVPLNVFSMEILEKHNYNLPVISNQKTNEYLKELGKLAGIKEPTLLTQYSGTKDIKVTEPKYNFITFHTARRTFVTLSLELGMRPETVMSITGHKDYDTFKKYIKITSKIKLFEMNKYWVRKPEMIAV